MLIAIQKNIKGAKPPHTCGGGGSVVVAAAANISKEANAPVGSSLWSVTCARPK